MLDCRLVDEAPPLAADVLACVSYGMPTAAVADPRAVQVPLVALAGPRHEVWRTEGPVRTGRLREFGFARTDALLFGQLEIRDSGPYAQLVEQAYGAVLGFVREQGCPHLVRCWNYFGDIHAGDGDAERYRQFCVGRHRAFAVTPDFERSLPAATVIGSHAPGTLIYFFAAPSPGTQVENPRQTPAYRYPRDYAPLAPSFSRAVLHRGVDRERLFVSGTASVVGHETRHPEQVLAQLDETLLNLRALLEAAPVADRAGLHPVALKAYVRRRGDLPAVRERLERAVGSQVPVLYVEGDVCRRDLVFEIEGVYATASSAP